MLESRHKIGRGTKMCYQQTSPFLDPKKSSHKVVCLTLLGCARDVRGVEPLVEVDVPDSLARDVRAHGFGN